MGVRIITDSISDISANVAKKFNIDVLPINVVLDGIYYKDDTNFSQELLINWIERNKAFPSFVGINPEEFKSAFAKYAQDNTDIVVITADDKIISNYNCAMHAATLFENINIHVINSETFSTAQAILVLKATDMAKQGFASHKIADEIQRLVKHPQMHMIFESIAFMKNTDYCPAILRMGESLLHVKYHFTAVVGKDYTAEPITGSGDKVIEKYCKFAFKKHSKAEKDRLVIMYTLGSENKVDYVHRYAENLDYFDEILKLPCRSYSSSIGGRESVGFAFILRI